MWNQESCVPTRPHPNPTCSCFFLFLFLFPFPPWKMLDENVNTNWNIVSTWARLLPPFHTFSTPMQLGQHFMSILFFVALYTNFLTHGLVYWFCTYWAAWKAEAKVELAVSGILWCVATTNSVLIWYTACFPPITLIFQLLISILFYLITRQDRFLLYTMLLCWTLHWWSTGSGSLMESARTAAYSCCCFSSGYN
jgi:hypothetical protein